MDAALARVHHRTSYTSRMSPSTARNSSPVFRRHYQHDLLDASFSETDVLGTDIEELKVLVFLEFKA